MWATTNHHTHTQTYTNESIEGIYSSKFTLITTSKFKQKKTFRF